MTDIDAQIALRDAVAGNNPEALRTLLLKQPDPVEALKAAKAMIIGMISASPRPCDKTIPIITGFWPDFVHARNAQGRTALLECGLSCQTGSMVALARAGADINATDFEGKSAFDHAIEYLNQGHAQNQVGQRAMQLRETGYDLNADAQAPSAFKLLGNLMYYGEDRWPDCLALINAGANVYTALGLTPPADGLFDREAVEQQFEQMEENPLSKKLGHMTDHLHQLYKDAAETFPLTHKFPATLKDLFNTGKSATAPELHPHVHLWEAYSLLPLLFQKDGGGRWEGGLNMMVEAHRLLPLHVQRHIDLVPVLRDTSMHRADSVTVGYISGHSPKTELS